MRLQAHGPIGPGPILCAPGPGADEQTAKCHLSCTAYQPTHNGPKTVSFFTENRKGGGKLKLENATGNYPPTPSGGQQAVGISPPLFPLPTAAGSRSLQALFSLFV